MAAKMIDLESRDQSSKPGALSLPKIRVQVFRNTCYQMVSEDSHPNIQCSQSTSVRGSSWVLLILGVGLLSGCTGILSNHSRSIPWLGRGAVLPTRMNAIWSKTTLQQPGQPAVRGVGGRVMFYQDQQNEPVTVEGTMIVYAYDRELEKSAKPARKYVFTADQLAKHYSKSEMGHSYSFWLPWGKTDGPPKQLTLIARFEPSDGAAILSSPASQHLPGIAPELLEDDDPISTGVPFVELSKARKEAVQPAQYVAMANAGQRKSTSMETITIDVPPSFVHSQGNLSSDPLGIQARVKKEGLNQRQLSQSGNRDNPLGVPVNRPPTDSLEMTSSLDRAASQEGVGLSVDSPPSIAPVQKASKLRPVADPHQTRRRLQAWLSERRPPRKAGPRGGSDLNR